MNVLYDHQIFARQRHGGISRYFAELLKSYGNDPEISAQCSLMRSNNEYYTAYQGLTQRRLLADLTLKARYYLFRLGYKKDKRFAALDWPTAYSARRLLDQNFDLFHPTYYDDYFMEYISQRPFVVTVYDMIYEKFADRYELAGKNEVIALKKRAMSRAKKVIAISQKTKDDIVEICGIQPEMVEVIHLGAPENLGPANRALPPLPRKYLLYVGSRGLYKNFDLMIKSLAPLLRADKDLYLVCVGGEAFGMRDRENADKLGIGEKVIPLTQIDDQLLFLLYRQALAFVFPSLYEGFGLPLLEAFKAGCPVIASCSSCLPEIGGGAAVYFDPENPDSIRETVAEVVRNELTRRSLIELGRKRLELFSWDRTAARTKQLYKAVIGS